MATILEKVLNVKKKISSIEYVLLGEWTQTHPIILDEIAEIEKFLPVRFPNLLRNFYYEEAGSLKFNWEVKEQKIFGDECIYGKLNILSPKSVLYTWQDMQDQVYEASRNKEIRDNMGLRALVDDWAHWLPLITFPNGDAFCLDYKENQDINVCSIRFLEHDVMDGGPFIHGLKIASNFNDLINKWSKIGFVDVFDWSLVTNDNGINLGSNILIKIIEKLGGEK